MSQRPPNNSEPRATGDKQPKLWRCGDPYRYPLPKPDGDPWDVLLQPYLKKYNGQCDAWKEEIQYLLIFAGLFSIVMTIFVLQSTQNLQQNSNDVSANMLSIIANNLNNIALNGSLAGGVTPTNITSASLLFTPSRSHVRISILWFISLILSLATLILGLVILQWIREHQRYTEDISSKEAVAVYHMREQAWKKWRVPQIISSLPVLLLIAVILFLAGVIVYLFTLNRTLAIAVTVIIGITLLFIVITTLLPALQCFILTLSEPSRKKDIPIPCPYKSSQSWIFYRLFAWLFRCTFSLGWNSRHMSMAFFVRPKQHSWMMFDSCWLTLRSTYSQFIHGVFVPSSNAIDPQSPGYDEAQILVYTMQKYSESSKTVLAAYHCFQDVSSTALKAQDDQELQDINSALRKRNQLLHMQYWNEEQYGKRTAGSNHLDMSDVQKMHDENMMLFLWLPGNRKYPDSIARGLASHMLELQSRKLAYTMTQSSLEDACLPDDREMLWLARIRQQYKPTDGAQKAGPWMQALHRRISKDVAEASVEQFVMIFDLFVRKCASEAGQAWSLHDLRTNVYGRAVLQNFLAIPSTLKGHLFTLSESYISSLFMSTLSFIASTLETSWMYSEQHERHDFLFFSTTYFLSLLFPSGSKNIRPDDFEIPAELLRSLSRYEDTINKAVWSTIFTEKYSIGDWSARFANVEASKTAELHGSKKLLVRSVDTPNYENMVSSKDDILLQGQSVKTFGSHGSPERSENRHLTQSSPILIQFDSDDRKGLQYGAMPSEKAGPHVKADQRIERIESQSHQIQHDSLSSDAQASDTQATPKFTSQESQNLLRSNSPAPNSHVGQTFQLSSLTSESRDVQGANSQENRILQSEIFTGNSRDIVDSQAIAYVQSQDIQSHRSAEDIRRFDLQNVRNLQSQKMQFDSSSNQQFETSNVQRFNSTSESMQRLESQDHRFNSFSSSQFDSTERRSWLERTHYHGESWSSRMIDQSLRSSKSAADLDHEAVDNNLFY